MLDRLLARVYDPVMARAEGGGLGAVRAEVLTGIDGTVVVVGAGTGADLPHLPDDVDRLVLVEPSAPMRERLRDRIPAARRAGTEVVDGFAERLPLADRSVDHVVLSLVLCSVRDPQGAVDEFARVLRPGGTVRVLEHGASTDPLGLVAQHVANPLWRALAGGCNLHRDPRSLLARRFGVADLHTVEVPAVSRIGRVTAGTAVR